MQRTKPILDALFAVGTALAIVFALFVTVGTVMGMDVLAVTKPKIYLLHFDGEITRSRISEEIKGDSGTTYRVGYVYPMTKIGFVHLHDNGTTSGSSYIRRWSTTKGGLL